MFDWIPLNYYSGIYYNVQLLLVLLTLLHSQLLTINERKNKIYIENAGYFLLLFTLFYMGFRPVSGYYFGDMATYNSYFERYQAGELITISEDVGFHIFMKGCSQLMSSKFFFFLCDIIYILPLWFVSKKWFGNYSFYGFLMLVGSFSFWSYGTNGIRNGMATSVFLAGTTFYKQKPVMLCLLLFACSIHKSLLLPSIAFGMTFIFNDPKRYIYLWIAAVPLSLLFGSFWEQFFSSLGFGDDRIGYLTSGNVNNDSFSNSGFRWDFLLYSATGVLAGYFFVIKMRFNDKFYHQLLNTYILVNAFWILIIRANFSNRFAYLSWFILGIIIIYPFLKQRFFLRPNQAVGIAVACYFIFTYTLNVILI